MHEIICTDKHDHSPTHLQEMVAKLAKFADKEFGEDCAGMVVEAFFAVGLANCSSAIELNGAAILFHEQLTRAFSAYKDGIWDRDRSTRTASRH